MNKILNRLRALIEERGWPYFHMEETDCIVVALEHSLVLFGVNEGRMGCRMVYKKEALPENREKLLEYMNIKNRSWWEGHYELDKDNVITYRTSMDISEMEEVPKELLSEMLGKVVKVSEEESKFLYSVAECGKDPKSAAFRGSFGEVFGESFYD